MNDRYRLRRAISPGDGARLREHFSQVFHPEAVGTLAETMFHHLPGMEERNWFIAEVRGTGQIAAAFALIPWIWELETCRLKVAEMGIVGTLEEHRGRGLQRMLNAEFDRTLAEEEYDLAVIQGIPGFYSQFGYSYAVPLENHINLPLHEIPADSGPYTYRLAGESDLAFLQMEDEAYRLERQRSGG